MNTSDASPASLPRQLVGKTATLYRPVCMVLGLILWGFCVAAQSAPPLKVLFLTGGGYHDYEKLTPFLTNHLNQLVNATFDVQVGIEALRGGIL